MLNMLDYAPDGIPDRITYMRLTSIAHRCIQKSRGCIIIENVRYRWSPSGRRSINTVRSKEGDGAETGLLSKPHTTEKEHANIRGGAEKGDRMHIARKAASTRSTSC